MNTRTALGPTPHISLVAVTRNDDHGGDLRGRTQHFVDGFIAQCRRHQLAAELILVEWNPPSDRAPLKESLQWPTDFGPASVRIVTVPPEVHAKFPHSTNLPLFQMVGKNVGIRRARGAFILATNIDILFDDAMVCYMRDKLIPGIVLRADRYDVPSNLPKGVAFKQILADCDTRFFNVNTRFGTFNSSSRRFLGMGVSFEARLLALYFEIKIFGIADALKRAGRGAGNLVIAAVSAISSAIIHLIVAISAYLKATLSIIFVLVSRAPAFIYRHPVKLWPVNTLPSRFYWWVRRNLRRIRSCIHQVQRFSSEKSHSVSTRLKSFVLMTQRFFGSLSRLMSRSGNVNLLERSRWLHTNACGDFTLLAREDWHRLHGYPEWPVFSWHLDSVLMFAAHAQGLREISLGAGYRIYHIDHTVGSGWSPAGHDQLFARLESKAIPYLSNDELRRWQLKFAENPESAIVNDENWGLKDHVLPEHYIFPVRGMHGFATTKSFSYLQ